MGDLSKNSYKSEFACPCCGLNHIHPAMGVIFELIREYEGGDPLSPSSGCRCLNHNERVQMDYNEHYVPFTSNSNHMPKTKEGTIDEENGICIASDFKSDNPKRLFDFLDKLFPNTFGIGLYSWGIHIDLRQKRARW